jgi:hypothetical protein
MTNSIEAGVTATPPDDLSKRLRRVSLVVPALSILGGAAAMAVDPRLGFLAVAIILGWAQLIGL